MEYIVVGHIQNTHGIKGELKIKPLTDYIERFEEDVNYFLGDKKVKAKIESFRFYRGLVYLKFTDFDNINQVLPFKGQYLYVEKSDRFEIDDGRYYIDDLIGFEGIEDGKVIGTLKDVLVYSANDVYVFDTGEREILVPGVKEFILKIDMQNKKIYLHLIEGM